jgi:ABC-type glutathione transport system ATPase component
MPQRAATTRAADRRPRRQLLSQGRSRGRPGRGLMTAHLLEVRDLVKHFPAGRDRSVQAVNGVSFEIARGEALALVGESGSGKTTVGRCLLRLLEPTSGAIRFDGTDVHAMTPAAFRPLRRRIQLVFQEPYDSAEPRACGSRPGRRAAATGRRRAGGPPPGASARGAAHGGLRRRGAGQVPASA